MFWVYILRCADNSYYTGHTDNLDKRIGEHQTGACAGYTSSRLPVELAWSQECPTREEALAAELQLKGWGRKKKEAMMCGDWVEVSRLAKGKSAHPSTSSGRTDLPVAPSPLPVPPATTVRPELVVRQAHQVREIPSVRPELVEGQGIRGESS
jgi:putative endonuclease